MDDFRYSWKIYIQCNFKHVGRNISHRCNLRTTNTQNNLQHVFLCYLLERKVFIAFINFLIFSSSPEACNFIKKEALAQVFSCEFCEISKNTFFAEHLRTTVSIFLHFSVNPFQAIHFSVNSSQFPISITPQNFRKSEGF